MRAMIAIKLGLVVVVVLVIGLIGYAMGATSTGAQIDKVQVEHLNSCLPITSTDELAQCMGVKIVGGQ